MTKKRVFLNLMKLAFTILLFVSFMGCAAESTVIPNDNNPNSSGGNLSSGIDDDADLTNIIDGDDGTATPTGFFIENKYNQTDNSSLKLGGAFRTTTAEVGGTTYLFVVGYYDDGVSVFRIAGDGRLVNTANVSDNASLLLNGAYALTTAEVSGRTYLFVAGFFDDGVSVFRVTDDGALINTANVSDTANLLIGGAREVTTAEVGGTTYLFVTGIIDNGFSVFRVASDGTLVNTANVGDSGDLKLSGAAGITTVEVGGMTYLFVAGANDDGFSMFRIAGDGTPINTINVGDTGNINDGNPNNLKLYKANVVTTAEVDGKHYLFVSGVGDDGFSMFRIASDGTLMNTTNVSDDSDLLLNRVGGMTVSEVDGNSYLFVTGRDDSGVSVFSIADDGMLMNITNVSDDGDLELYGAEGITTAEVGETTYLFVTGFNDNGVSVFEFGWRGATTP